MYSSDVREDGFCHMGAAVTLKDRLSFSIIVIFLLSFVCLLSALFLSWSEKENVSYFLNSALILSAIGAVLCASKTVSISELIKLVLAVRGK